MRQDFRENVLLAFDTLRAHKLRSFLTVLGVMIGVGVIIVVGALLVGFDRAVTQEISGVGADTAFVYRFQQGIRTGRMSKEERTRKPLSVEDADAIAEGAPAVKSIAVSLFPRNVDTQRVRYKDQEVIGIDYRGTFPSFVDVYANAAMKEGRFFSAAENHHRRNVAVIGEDIADALFPGASAVGKEVLVGGSSFVVVGVFERPSGGFGDDQDRRVAVPYYTIRKLFPHADEHGFRIQAHPGQLDAAVDQTRDVLRRRRGVGYNEPDSFSIQTSQQIVEQFHAIVGMVALVMVVLSSIGLLVGGVGVMNIMLVSVTERTREIGVRKAIGARRRDITWQFLTEAVALTGAGGILGMGVASGIAMLIPLVTSFQAAVPLWAILLGLAVSVNVGLVSGVWPAIKAARLDPVDALRYE